MKRIAFFVVLCFIPFLALARIHRTWSYVQLRDGADLIVIAAPLSVKETSERSPLPDIALVKPDSTRSDVIGTGIETTFEVLAVLKGEATLKTFVLHHYTAEPAVNGPGLVRFEPKYKEVQEMKFHERKFLMFLKREADGRFCAVSGQTDPNISVREIGGGYP